MQTFQTLQQALAPHHLDIMGGIEEPASTLLLIGPAQGFWPHFKRQPEFTDGKTDPIDRWSLRVLTKLANDLNAEALFPFGGPPYLPFITWATQSGHTWSSPTNLLVHDTAGLFVSFRGALRFDHEIELPAQGQKPCEKCIKPCLTACPVNALTPEGYDTQACHAYLDTSAGRECLTNGCKARRACPVSQRFDRDPEQSAHHMSYFHKKGR